MREDVDEHLGVAAGVEVAPVNVEKLGFQIMRVGQVAVVHQHDAKGRVDVKGLRFFFVISIARRGVAHLTQAHVARQGAHVSCAENVAHHAVRFVHVAARALHGDDARSVLPAVLQEQERVVDQLVGRR